MIEENLSLDCMKNFVALSLLTILSISQLSADISQSSDSICQESQIEFSYNIGKFISIEEDYFEADMIVPLFSSKCYTPFLDVRGYHFNDGKWAANLGFGIRKNLSECSVLGINTYYDYRRGKSKNNFHQIGLGFEWLNSCWDIRINGYLPISQKTQTFDRCVFDHLGDGFVATRRRIEYAYSGFDGEIGISLLSYCDFNLYSAIGPYYYRRSRQNHFWGGYGRLELDWKSIISFQVQMSYDKVYSTNVQGIIQISVPLDFFCSCSCWGDWGCHRLINQRVRRNGIIQTDHCCDWTWNWDDRN